MSNVFEIPTCIPDLTDYIVKGEHPEATNSHYHISKCTWDRPNYSPVLVAVKVIRVLQPLDLTERYDELLQEIRVWGRLQNEHILPVLGHVRGHGYLPSLVFPWMENGSLTNFLRERQTLERGERYRLLLDIALALQYLHVIAVVHGDLTGDNILVDWQGRAFVTGVGLSKRLNEIASNGSESSLGDNRSATIRWIAPELVDDKESFPTAKSDVWSFGCNMIHVLSGQLPWWPIRSNYIPLQLLCKEVPPLPPIIKDQARDSSFLRKCFSFQPVDRPSADQTLAFVREALRTGMPQTAESVSHDHDNIPPVDQHYRDTGIPDVVAEFKRRVFLVPSHLIYVPNMELISRDKLITILKPETITEADIRRCGGWSRQLAIESAVINLLKYAILSHRWGESEPTFQDLKREEAGYKKLEKFCSKAREYGCDLAWSDTCCINKESSSELDEAIRSMYMWYREAHICIVHLAQTNSWNTLERDEWFFRGWTLQELLAPLRMRFYYGPTWTPLTQNPNDKDDAKVVHALHRATKIPENDLRNFRSGPNRAWEKMSWAASRKTTRIEDVAYSLTGIFDITMTVAYGEGDRAFERFMAELIEKCKEWQILVWAGGLPGCPTEPSCYRTTDEAALEMLKNHEISWWGEGCGDDDFSVTKRGVQVKLFMVPASIEQSLWQSVFLSRPLSTGDLMTPPLDKLVVQSPFFPPASTTEWAIGIVNYHDHDDAMKGKLKAGQSYICFLLRRFCRPGLDTVRNHWRREVTEKILTVRCEHDYEKEVEIVWL